MTYMPFDQYGMHALIHYQLCARSVQSNIRRRFDISLYIDRVLMLKSGLLYVDFVEQNI